MRWKQLIRIVQDVCLLPLNHNHEIWHGKSDKAVRAIFKAIVKGLKKDGFVNIRGFGKFQVVKNHGYIRSGTFNKKREYVPGVVFFPGKPKVIFTPMRTLRDALRDEEQDGV